MKKCINPEAITIQKRFFEALDYIIANKPNYGIKTFCDDNKLNRVKYTNIRNQLSHPDEMTYKKIDIDALSAICRDFGISADWLLLGKGKMLKSKGNAHK